MEFSFEVVVYLLGLAATAGTILARISALERKVERHNGLIERVYKLEQWHTGTEKRLDDLEREVRQ